MNSNEFRGLSAMAADRLAGSTKALETAAGQWGVFWADPSRRSLVALTGALALVLIAAIVAILLSLQAQSADRWLRRSLDVDSRLNQVQTLVSDAETGQRGYLLTAKDSYLLPYEAARRDLGPELETLAKETADNPFLGKAIRDLRKLIEEKLDELQRTIQLRASGATAKALAVVNDDSGNRLMTDIRRAIATMRDQETQVAQARAARVSRLDGVGRGVLVAAVFLMAGFGALALSDARRRIYQLQTANKTLEREKAERTAAETQVRQLQKMEAIGKLTGGIAHDFNNMLAVIIGSLEIARRRLSGSGQTAVLKSIDNASEGANRAAVLTARLLAFSRQQPLEPAIVDANKLAAGMSEMLRRTIGETISVETVLAGGLWRTFSDPAQLESALVNLTVNARDAMPAGGKLTIETANTELDERYAAAHSEVRPGQYVMISVTDTGTGMPAEVIERAFDPFYTTKGPGKGTGLGLSQVFGFVKQSAGHIKIYSEIGHGTTVKIYLPRHVGEAHGPPERERAQGLPPGSAETIILVVEDEATVRNMTVASLRELGYTVVHAPSAEDALPLLESHPDISLLLTDIVLPGLNGRQLADHATARMPHLKVLFTTGYTRNAIIHNGIVDPGLAFLAKPFTLAQLANKVDQTLRAEEALSYARAASR